MAEEGNRDLAEVSAELRINVTRLSRRLRQERLSDGLSPTKVAVLGRLERDGPASASALAAAERIQPQSMTRVLADLEQLELVVRARHPRDGRQVLQEISPRGRELVEAERRHREEWLAVAMGESLNGTEVEVLRMASRLLGRLAEW